MKSISSVLFAIRYFVILITIFFITSFLVVVFSSKMETHLFINQFHSDWADIFFKYYTNVGDGAFILVLLPYFIFVGKLRNFIICILTFCFTGFFCQFFKRKIYSDILRPASVFSDGVLHTIDGVDLHCLYSFPSGHSASAFAFFAIVAFISQKNYYIQALAGLMAILVAFSRVYLSQHFLVDTLAGGLIGVFSFLLAYKFIALLKEYPILQFSIWKALCSLTIRQN